MPTPPRPIIAKFEEKIVHNAKFTTFQFELAQPHELQFEAGQYVSIQVSDLGERRSYSISSSAGIAHGFEIMVDVTPMGVGSQFLQQLQFGDEIKILAPLGRFVLEPSEPAYTFVATGSGIGPMLSMVRTQLQEQKDTRPMILYWGLRLVEDLTLTSELQDLATRFPNFRFHPTLSQSPQEWPLCRGRVTDCLQIHDLLPDSGYYLCGNERMVRDTMTLLESRGVALERIHHEKFY